MSDIDTVKSLPPAEPDVSGTSKWIKPTGMMPPEYHGHYECMKCGGWAMKDWRKPWSNGGVVLTKYCPHCGRKMENGNE